MDYCSPLRAGRSAPCRSPLPSSQNAQTGRAAYRKRAPVSFAHWFRGFPLLSLPLLRRGPFMVNHTLPSDEDCISSAPIWHWSPYVSVDRTISEARSASCPYHAQGPCPSDRRWFQPPVRRLISVACLPRDVLDTQVPGIARPGVYPSCQPPRRG